MAKSMKSYQEQQRYKSQNRLRSRSKPMQEFDINCMDDFSVSPDLIPVTISSPSILEVAAREGRRMAMELMDKLQPDPKKNHASVPDMSALDISPYGSPTPNFPRKRNVFGGNEVRKDFIYSAEGGSPSPVPSTVQSEEDYHGLVTRLFCRTQSNRNIASNRSATVADEDLNDSVQRVIRQGHPDQVTRKKDSFPANGARPLPETKKKRSSVRLSAEPNEEKQI
ncbi:hypothetical protein EDC01DRAFT_634182 [Geopyxis carbonaria]|nr:hypothetical protein EDC01DRAFT_634182 [Geopyxis carbonaria]